MRVVELAAWHVRVPLKKAIRHASHARTETDNVVVRCTLADGTVGWGEGVPRDYVTGETVDSALRLLQSSDVPAQLEDAADFPAAAAMIDRLKLPTGPGDDRDCLGNAARCALELALLDAFAKHFGQPLSALVPMLAPELHEPREHIQYSGAITSANGWKARIAAWKMRIFGFKQIKVKVGIQGQDDVRRLGIIRSRIGPRMDVRIDANEAWSEEEAARKIIELKPFAITSVEQPVSHERIGILPALRREVGVPIMLDESLCSMVDAERAAGQGACDLFNLRLSKCGGFLRTLRLAQFAKEHGLGYQLGCQVGETCILSAAGRHFACAVRDLRYVEGSYDRHLVKESLGKRDITFRWGGWAKALPGPGLGVEIDPQRVERITVRREVLLG